MPDGVYSLDANILIEPYRSVRGKGYYHPAFVEKYWEWLVENGKTGKVFMSEEVFRELEAKDDWLRKWISKNKEFLAKPDHTENISNALQTISSEYGMTLDELEGLGADPYVIAHGLALENGVVVSNEMSAPESKNKKIPDICQRLGIKCITGPEFLEELKFTANV